MYAYPNYAKLLFIFFLYICQTDCDKSTTVPSSVETLENSIIHDYLVETGAGNREYFGVHAILQTDVNITSKALEWLTLSMDDIYYVVGRMPKSVAVISIRQLEKFVYHAHEVVTDVLWEITAIATCEYSNVVTNSYAGIVTIALNDPHNTLHWYTLDNFQLTLRGTLKCPHKVIGMIMYKVDDIHELLILYEGTLNGAMASRYYFGLTEKMSIYYREVQNIPLAERTTSASIGFGNDNVYLAFVQRSLNKVAVYSLDLPSYFYGDFHHIVDFKSEGVTSVKFFKSAGRQYWLVNGKGACIYVLESNNAIKKALTTSFGAIDEWMVVNFQTYRNDVFLLGKKKSEMISLTWQGTLDGFLLTTPQIPCWKLETQPQPRLNGVICEDMACIYTQEWAGSAIVLIGEFPFLLFADTPGKIYNIVGYLESMKSPETEIFLLETEQANIEEKWKLLKNMMIETALLPPQEMCEEVPLIDLPKGSTLDVNQLRNNISSLSDRLSLLENSVASHHNLVGAPAPFGLSGNLTMDLLDGTVRGDMTVDDHNTPYKTPITGSLKFQSPFVVQTDDKSQIDLEPNGAYIRGGLRSSHYDYGHIQFDVNKMYINEKIKYPFPNNPEKKNDEGNLESNHPWETHDSLNVPRPLHKAPYKTKKWKLKL